MNLSLILKIQEFVRTNEPCLCWQSTFWSWTWNVQTNFEYIPGWQRDVKAQRSHPARLARFWTSRCCYVCGANLESKWIYDVILSTFDNDNYYGISCKMRGTLREVERKGRVTIELSNAAGEFWGSLKEKAVAQDNFHDHPEIVGATLIGVVERWHQNVGIDTGGIIDNSKSFFLSLQIDVEFFQSRNNCGSNQHHKCEPQKHRGFCLLGRVIRVKFAAWWDNYLRGPKNYYCWAFPLK